jgi:hypothetical protein
MDANEVRQKLVEAGLYPADVQEHGTERQRAVNTLIVAQRLPFLAPGDLYAVAALLVDLTPNAPEIDRGRVFSPSKASEIETAKRELMEIIKGPAADALAILRLTDGHEAAGVAAEQLKAKIDEMVAELTAC